MTSADALESAQAEVLGPLVRVIQEAADEDVWALVGAASIRLQGGFGASPNLEFITTEAAAVALAEMLDIPVQWSRGEHLDARRLHFLRREVPVFVHAAPTFHGSYDRLSPLEIPSLWDARSQVEVRGTPVAVTPLEWELLLAVVLGLAERADALAEHLRERGCDGRLLTRLMREGHAEQGTEEAVWALLEVS